MSERTPKLGHTQTVRAARLTAGGESFLLLGVDVEIVELDASERRSGVVVRGAATVHTWDSPRAFAAMLNTAGLGR